MDEIMVTNHHFATFLNEMKSILVVENGIVKNNDVIWFYLGEGTASDEQIIYDHGRFHLRDTELAANPVVRVTWYGASAYASHYGKRLPTESEWAYAVSKHLIPDKQPTGKKADNPKINTDKTPTSSQTRMHMMHMDDTFDAGKSRSKKPEPPATKEPGENMKAWVIRNNTSRENANGPESKEDISYPSLVAATSQYPGQQFKNFRYPWEAFPDVGFRCAVSLKNED
jgi:serine/threonine-protein kinase